MEDGHCQRCIHAEINAIAYATGNLDNCVLYIYRTNSGSVGEGPCRECWKIIKAHRINDVKW